MPRTRTPLRVVFAVALVSLAVALATGTASAAVPFCSVNHLAPVYVDSTAGAGSIDAEYGFQNLGAQSCELTGFPHVQLLKASGRRLPTIERLASGAYGIAIKPVTVAHKAIAYFGVHYASATGFGRLKCPTSSALQLTPPGGTIGLVLRGKGARIQPYGGSIPHLQCGTVAVSAVTAKRFQ